MVDLVTNQVQVNPYENFCFGLRSKETQRQYPKILNIFLDFILIDNHLYQNSEIVKNYHRRKMSYTILHAKRKPKPSSTKNYIFCKSP